jgi:hypothetical protein
VEATIGGPTYHLGATSTTTGGDLPDKLDPSRFWIASPASDEVVDRELNGLFWRHALRRTERKYIRAEQPKERNVSTHNKLRRQASVEPYKTLVLVYFFHAVETVAIEDLPNHLVTLILHTRLDPGN